MKRFNVRVYGLWIHEGSVLVNDETIRGDKVIKFPGGGLEWGEGPRECLVREFREELNLDIKVEDHFYTTDIFVKSAWDDTQVISLYYTVSADAPDTVVNLFPAEERSFWMPLSEVHEDRFTLPLDKVVARMLRQNSTGFE
jgi:ADP-ribose pyrophosphatase YjhB (NUDIX family)